jgi:hypothetical protein
MHRATDGRTLLNTAVLVNNCSLFQQAIAACPSAIGAFRYSDFWRSRRGSLSRADNAVIPRLVRPNPTAGSAVIGPAATTCPARGHRVTIPGDKLLGSKPIKPSSNRVCVQPGSRHRRTSSGSSEIDPERTKLGLGFRGPVTVLQFAGRIVVLSANSAIWRPTTVPCSTAVR